MHSYLLVFDDSTISRQELIAHIDRLGAVANWMAFLPSAVALISPLSAHDLSAALRERRSGMRFLLSRLDPKATDGLLPAEVWSFLNDPAAVPGASGRVPQTSLTRRSA